MPDAGMFAAADQITVAVHDLALVLTDEGQVEEAVGLVAQAQKRAGRVMPCGPYRDAMTRSARM